jgi:hypothetical protein
VNAEPNPDLEVEREEGMDDDRERTSMKRWAVVDPDGTIVSRHLLYRAAFYAAREHTLLSKTRGRWQVQRLG